MRDEKDAQRRQLYGVAFMCVGVFVFTFQDLIIKGISGKYPAHEIVFIRSFFALPFALLIAWLETGLHRLRTPRFGAHLRTSGAHVPRAPCRVSDFRFRRGEPRVE